MNNVIPAAVMQKRDLHRTYAEGGKMRGSVVGKNERPHFSSPVRKFHPTAAIPSGNLTEETGQQTLMLLLEWMAGADTSMVHAAAKPPLADPTCQIYEGKLMVTAQIMRPVKEIIS